MATVDIFYASGWDFFRIFADVFGSTKNDLAFNNQSS